MLKQLISVCYRMCLSNATPRLSNKWGNNYTCISSPVSTVGSWPDPVSHGVRQKGYAKHRMPSGVNTGIVKLMTLSCLVKAELILVTSWHGDQSHISGTVWQMNSNHKLQITNYKSLLSNHAPIKGWIQSFKHATVYRREYLKFGT